MATKTYTITIGRNVPANRAEGSPLVESETRAVRTTDGAAGRYIDQVTTYRLTEREWERFRFELRTLCLEETTEVYFHGIGAGIYEGVPEDAYTIIGSLDTDTDAEYILRRSCRIFCQLYDQDSIAFTIGDTTLEAQPPFGS